MPQARVLTDREIKSVLRTINTRRHAFRDRAMFLLGLYTGMRAKELAALRICDVLTRDGQVRDTFNLSKEQTKGRKGRVVVVGKKAQQEVKNYLCERFGTSDLSPILLTDTLRPLFSTQKNPRSGFSPNTLAGHFSQLMREACIEGASSHSMRRTFITNLADKGVSVHILQALAGHSNIQTTARYIQANDVIIRRAAELV